MRYFWMLIWEAVVETLHGDSKLARISLQGARRILILKINRS